MMNSFLLALSHTFKLKYLGNVTNVNEHCYKKFKNLKHAKGLNLEMLKFLSRLKLFQLKMW